MKLIFQIYHFLGSIYFALFLIASVVLFVIVGTVIESNTQSHGQAAYFTYQNRLFILLLYGFFLNILISALRRWPFRFKHIPFLITHFGLLMILAGSLMKSYFGLQGNLIIKEGMASNEIVLPNTYAIEVTKKDEKIPANLVTEIKQIQTQMKILDLNINLISWCPHCTERFEIESVLNNLQRTVVAYDQGFAGYKVEVTLPFSFSLPLKHFRKGFDNDKAFIKSLMEFLSFWEESKYWILPMDLSLPSNIESIFAFFDWSNVPANEKKACIYAARIILDIISYLEKGKTLSEILMEKRWPFFQNLENFANVSDFFFNLVKQIFSVVNELPEPEWIDFQNLTSNVKASLFTVWLKAYEYEEYNAKKMVVELPLNIIYEASEPLKKWEENIPKIILKIQDGEKIQFTTLAYDRSDTGIKMPLFNGKYLISFKPYNQKIPYRIRLRQARNILYPNTSQPYSFESDIVVTDSLGKSKVTTISMNNVHETKDGYRFYLANLTSLKSGLKQIQLVVNHDPGKYYLTYPGAFILSLGIIMLFFFSFKE